MINKALKIIIYPFLYLFFFKKLTKFHNKHLGETCLIIGNGPSINKMDLNKIQPNIKIFGMNKIYLKNPMPKIDYLVCVNKLVIKQSLEAFKKINATKFISISGLYKIFQNNYYHLPDIFKGPPFSLEIDKSINQGGTVTYVTIQLAVYMGFSKIYLIGVDHNFKQNGKPNTVQLLDGDDNNHFHPEYFKGQKWQLADLEKSEKHYKIAKEHCDRNNVEIIDCTIDGKLNIFLKENFKILYS